MHDDGERDPIGSNAALDMGCALLLQRLARPSLPPSLPGTVHCVSVIVLSNITIKYMVMVSVLAYTAQVCLLGQSVGGYLAPSLQIN